MKNPDYSTFDQVLMDSIKEGCNTLSQLEFNSEIIREGAQFTSPRSMLFRIIDRRLQTLRKRGAIQFMRGKWHVGVDHE